MASKKKKKKVTTLQATSDLELVTERGASSSTAITEKDDDFSSLQKMMSYT